MKNLFYRKKWKPLTLTIKTTFTTLVMSSVDVEFDGGADVD